MRRGCAGRGVDCCAARAAAREGGGGMVSGRARGGGGGGLRAGGGLGELAGLPQGEEGFEAGEDAQEPCLDEGA